MTITNDPAFSYQPPAAGAVLPASNLAEPQGWFRNWATGGADAGRVNEFTALGLSAVYACVKLISGSIAALPLKVYKRRKDGGQDEAWDEPEYRILKDEYNPNSSAMTARQAGVAHLLTWGNCYTQVVAPRGEVSALQPIGPDCVRPRLEKGRLVYDVYQRGSGEFLKTFDREDILHVPGMSFDALVGMSPTALMRRLLTTAAAQDKTACGFATKGIRPPGGVKLPVGGKFKSNEDARQFRENFKAIHAHDDERDLNIVVLQDGAEWFDLGVNPEAFQLLESRQFTRGEIAGAYLVPPHMIGDSEKSTSWGTGIEEMTTGFIVYCLLPYLRAIEAENNRKLFAGRPEFFCEHTLSGLLRGDTLKRSQALEIQHRRGIISDNEWRKLEGLNPVPGGDVRHFPLNEARVDSNGDTLPAPPGAAPSPTKALPEAN